MDLQIICVEEHVTDLAITKATLEPLKEQAPYVFDVGTTYHDDPSQQTPGRPGLQDSRKALLLLAEPLHLRISAMDEAGIDMQVLSYSTSTQAVPLQDAAALATAANDRLAEWIAKHPARFAGFSTLPWQDPAAAVREASRCALELGIKATLLNGHAGKETLLDDEQFDPVLAKLAELGMPLYVHPGAPLRQVQIPYYGGFDKEVTARLSLFSWGWHNEAGVQVLRLILSGALDRYPNLKIISGHWGEMVPFFLQRLDDTMPKAVTGLRRTLTQTYRDQVWVAPSGMLDLAQFNFVREVLGPERILFAVDYPFLSMTGARRWIEDLPITEQERVAIANGNARKLLGL